MNKNSMIRYLFFTMLVSMLFYACKKADDTVGQKHPSVNVKIEIVKPTRLVDAIQVAGTVKAFEDVNISPEEGGVIKEWKVKKGQRVQKGDLLVVLRDELVKAGLDAAS